MKHLPALLCLLTTLLAPGFATAQNVYVNFIPTRAGDVTVPAGTFAGACKWQFVEGGTTTTTWNTKAGVPLRSTSPGSAMVLIGGSINGGALR